MSGPGTGPAGAAVGSGPGADRDAVAPGPGPTPDPAALAELVADAVLAHPAVAGLHGGTFGAVATWLPGRRLVGVHVGRPGEPVEIGVVLTLDRPVPATVASLRRTVSALVGGVPIDVTVADVVVGPDGTA